MSQSEEGSPMAPAALLTTIDHQPAEQFRRWPGSAPSPDHLRAEELRAEVETCADRSRRCELRREAVVITLDLVDGVARRYHGRGMERDDLVQVGRMALVKVANGYRCGQGRSF